jgi:hypothetical protein
VTGSACLDVADKAREVTLLFLALNDNRIPDSNKFAQAHHGQKKIN